MLGPSSQVQDKIVDKFESHGEFAFQSLLRLGAETRTPFGLIPADLGLCTTHTEISVEGESLASITDKLTSQAGYAWTVENGVMVIQPSRPPLGVLQLLDTVLPRFAAPRTTLQGLGVFLTIDVRAIFHPEVGSAGSLSRSPSAVLAGPLEMHDITVRQALNEIVKRGRRGMDPFVRFRMIFGRLPTPNS